MLWALMFSLSLAAASVAGVVKDTTGAVVPGATVIVQTDSATAQAVTGPDGRFVLEKAPDGPATLIVRAGGFAEKRQPLSPSSELEIVLSPASLLETVTVTPTRGEQRLGDIPASVDVLTREEIQASPAIVADDVLRQVPTFSLFRRTSSLSSHPTSQGVSLRGIGPSGVSRTLVLMDGVPFNDPFGGWVYWTRVPLVSVDRIEITEDTNSSLYGNYAMGGVINIVTAQPSKRTVEIKPQYGNHKTPKFDFFAGDRWNKLGAALEGSFFDTDGFANVAANERGPIDINADVKYKNLTGKADYTPTERLSVSMRGGYFSEDRTNAKIGEINDTRWKFFNAGLRSQLPDGSDLQARVFVDAQQFHSTFLAVTNSTCAAASLSAIGCAVPTRNFVRLSVDQHVPTHSVGSVVQWSRVLGRMNVFEVGGDWRWVHGNSNEDSYNAFPGTAGSASNPAVTNPSPWNDLTPVTLQATLALQRVAGGSQQLSGAFVQDIFTPTSRLSVTLSGRIDHWRNYDAHNLETAVIPGTLVNNQPSLNEQIDTVASPRVGALYHVTDWLTGWAAVGSGFRAPTLNELYRQFTQGTTRVLANSALGPERLFGGEGGVNIAPLRSLTVKTTWFDNRVDNPVTNVTICNGTINVATGACVPSATNITQQRQNLGRTRIRGLQTQADYRLRTAWRVSAAYVYDIAKVSDGGTANPALANNCPGPISIDPTQTGQSCFVPQVPKHRGSFQISYTEPKYLSVAFGVQYIGRQYDDDQNVRAVPLGTLTAAGYSASTEPGLPGYATADLMLSRTVGRNLDVFFGVENMFNKEPFVGTLPTTIGSPRLVNGGVRVRFSGR
jgi:outer membrane receptor protein involved in Fe transport